MSTSDNDYGDFEGFFHVKVWPNQVGFTVMRTPLPEPDGQPPDQVIAIFPEKWRAEDYAAACNRGHMLVVPGGRWHYEVPSEPPSPESPTIQ